MGLLTALNTIPLFQSSRIPPFFDPACLQQYPLQASCFFHKDNQSWFFGQQTRHSCTQPRRRDTSPPWAVAVLLHLSPC